MPQPPTAARFEVLFRALDEQLRTRLTATRATFQQSGDKGTAAERAFRDTLASYLPRRLAIGNGEVIDTNGSRSSQLDLVVVGEDHPFTFSLDSPGLFFIEGVLAVAEVKSVLTSEELTSALKNAQLFKTLQAKASRGTLRIANPSDIPRFHTARPCFLFAYESRLTLETIADRLVREEGETGAAEKVIDAVFLLDRGTIINLGNGLGSFGVLNPDGQKRNGWIINPTRDTLFGLVAWLSLVMPRFKQLTPILPDYLVQIP